MSTYIVGDIQGCFDQLKALLSQIHFDPQNDHLWCVGDLVNRGPKSLETLRFLKNLPHCICVLGNHDLFLLSLAHEQSIEEPHSLTAILNADDRDELISWLRKRPMLHYDEAKQILMVHAGIPPCWDFHTALTAAKALEAWVQDDQSAEQFNCLYGDTPNQWDNSMTGMDRIRFIANAFSRIRLCHSDGSLNLSNRGPLSSKSEEEFAWFEKLHPSFQDKTVVFGHWAALGERTLYKNVIGLDTGCVWGNKLTAYCIENEKFFETPGVNN